MTTLKGKNGDNMQLIFSNTIHEINRNTYMVEMPIVICDNKKNAERMQEDINLFINELSRKLLNNNIF